MFLFLPLCNLFFLSWHIVKWEDIHKNTLFTFFNPVLLLTKPYIFSGYVSQYSYIFHLFEVLTDYICQTSLSTFKKLIIIRSQHSDIPISSSHGINPACLTAPIAVPYTAKYDSSYFSQTFAKSLNILNTVVFSNCHPYGFDLYFSLFPLSFVRFSAKN